VVTRTGACCPLLQSCVPPPPHEGLTRLLLATGEAKLAGHTEQDDD
jgi:hypothetical protein